MIHLITVVDKSAKDFFLERQYTSDFKSLIRTITSGRVMIVSTKFRSDLFYHAEKSKSKAIIKLWALYAKASLSNLNTKDFTTTKGDEKSLSEYFQSINKISTNWHYYRLYKKAFRYAFNNDEQNPVAKVISQCDQYLTEHPSIKRTALINSSEKINPKLRQDSFSLAMHIINNENHSN